MLGLFKFLIKPIMFLLVVAGLQQGLIFLVKGILDFFEITPTNKTSIQLIQIACMLTVWIVVIRYVYRRWRGKHVKAKHDKGLNKKEKIKETDNTLNFHT